MTLSNRPIYDDALNQARLFGENLRTATGNKRRMCVRLVESAIKEGQAVETGITDIKAAMKWSKLDKKDQNNLQKDFGYVRTIVSNWPLVTEEQAELFFAGKITPSSFADALIKAENQRLASLEKQAEDERQTEEGKEDLPPVTTVETGGAPESGPSEIFTLTDMALHLSKALYDPNLEMTEELASALMILRADLNALAEQSVPAQDQAQAA